MTVRHERALLGLIVVLFGLLALAYSLGPIFEGPDEIAHYRYIRVLAQEGTFPDPYAYPEGEMHQAPLYYLLLAPFASALDDADFATIDGSRNPYHGYEIGIPGNDNRNFYLHTRAEAFPYMLSPTARTVHILRLVSVLIGLVTLRLCIAIFRRLWPDQPVYRVLATGFVAFLPQFAYSTSVLSNDVLLYGMTTASLYLLLRVVQDGPSWRLMILLGLALGGALLSEISAAFLVFPVGLAVLSDRRTWPGAVVTLLVTLLVAGPWYARNLVLFGDLTGVSSVFVTWDDAVNASGLLDRLQIGLTQVGYAYRGFWARFGYGAVVVGEPLYCFYDGLALVVGLGAGWRVVGLVRERPAWPRLRVGLVLTAFGLTWIAALIYWSSTVWTGNQGRFLLTSAGVWGALFAFGIGAWLPLLRHPWRVALSLCVVLLSVGLLALFGYFFPAYRVLPAETPAAPVAYTYDGLAELTGISPAAPHARPGDVLTITLHWRALAASDHLLQTYLHTAGDTHVIRRDSLPATGNLLSTDWLPGETWAERYMIRIPEDTPTQHVYALVAGLYDPVQEVVIPATTPAGEVVTPVVGHIAINGPASAEEAVYCFGDAIGLVVVEAVPTAGGAEVCLRWVARQAPAADYQVFVHLLGPDGVAIAQSDGPPLAGQYPTSAWQQGESIDECVSLAADSLPEGWQAALGLYTLPDAVRLPASTCGGARFPDDRVLVEPH